MVWEDGKMNKPAYRKFKVMTVLGVDDFASMREVVTGATGASAKTLPRMDGSRHRIRARLQSCQSTMQKRRGFGP